MITLESICPFCGHSNFITVYEEDFIAWQEGALVQEAFPYLTAGEREAFISGMCETCWDKMFTEIEEEDW